uniref:Uncharacterized protein n=2 Tax=Oryza TaxID=4527 RepID=A0A0E0GCR7_ORYNI
MGLWDSLLNWLRSPFCGDEIVHVFRVEREVGFGRDWFGSGSPVRRRDDGAGLWSGVDSQQFYHVQ